MATVSAVRFGRVPKREKAKMVEEMQRTSAQSQLDALAVQFENEADAIERIATAFTLLRGTVCDFVQIYLFYLSNMLVVLQR